VSRTAVPNGLAMNKVYEHVMTDSIPISSAAKIKKAIRRELLERPERPRSSDEANRRMTSEKLDSSSRKTVTHHQALLTSLITPFSE
jgi:hypothetical protein